MVIPLLDLVCIGWQFKVATGKGVGMGLGKGIGKELGKGSGIVESVGSDKKVDNEEELGKIAEVERVLDNEEVAIVDEDTGV